MLRMKLGRSREDRIINVVTAVLCILVLIVTVYPVYYCLIYSFNDGRDAARQALYFSISQPSDPFCQQMTGMAADLFNRNFPQYGKFRTQIPQKPFVLILYLHAGGGMSDRRSDHFRKGHQAFKPLCARKNEALFPVRQLFHSV